MEYGLETIAEPNEEPVGLDDAKAHLVVTHEDDDTMIAGWIKAARELSESYTGRRWVDQTLRLTLAGFPSTSIGGFWGVIHLPVDPVSAVDWVKYYDADGTLTTLAGSEWQHWLSHSPPLVAPAPNKLWPAVQVGRLGAVQIQFAAGFTDASSVPESVKAAIRLCLGYWYEHRGDSNDPAGTPHSLGLPPAAKRLFNSVSAGSYR